MEKSTKNNAKHLKSKKMKYELNDKITIF